MIREEVFGDNDFFWVKLECFLGGEGCCEWSPIPLAGLMRGCFLGRVQDQILCLYGLLEVERGPLWSWVEETGVLVMSSLGPALEGRD